MEHEPRRLPGLVYTPLLWLVGLGLTGRRFYVPVSFAPWVYPLIACVFVTFHVTHVNLVYTRVFGHLPGTVASWRPRARPTDS